MGYFNLAGMTALARLTPSQRSALMLAMRLIAALVLLFVRRCALAQARRTRPIEQACITSGRARSRIFSFARPNFSLGAQVEGLFARITRATSRQQFVIQIHSAQPGRQEPSLMFERSYRLYGAVTGFDQRQRYGNYFDFFWRAKRPRRRDACGSNINRKNCTLSSRRRK